jgi:N-acetylglutamate synthase-like GNAT family acetyltransferase
MDDLAKEYMIIKSPISPDEWESYYRLRFNILREPWNQPLGSEVLADESEAIHAMVTANDQVIGVARMHKSGENQGQVRCVAVAAEAQGKGVGKAIMLHLEVKAKEMGMQEIVLEARENAVPFYQSIGYVIEKESYLLFGEIQHYRMKKEIR